MKDSRTRGVLNGLLAASLVTMALIGALFFGWSVAGLPFVPFDVFDWLTRVLPGRLIADAPVRDAICFSNWVGGDLIGTTRWTGVSLQRLHTFTVRCYGGKASPQIATRS